MWQLTTLGEYYDVRDGTHGSPKYIESGFPLVTSKNLKEGKIDLSKVKYISEKDYTEINKRSGVDVGDVLMAMIGTIGNPVEVVEPVNFAIKNVALFKTNENQSPSFLRYLLNHPRTIGKMVADAKGATQKFVGLGYLRNFPILVPPLAEQQRIVAKLDAAFAEIDKAASVLIQKKENARKVFESLLAAIFQSESKSWNKHVLKDITDKIGSGATPRGGQASYKEEGVSLIRSMNVHDLRFRHKNLAKIDNEQASKLDNVIVKHNDVLLNITGASVARCCVVESEILPARVNQHVSIIRVKESTIIPKLLAYGLVSKPSKDKLLEVGDSGGATRQAITKKQIEEFEFGFPSDKEVQIELIEKLDSIAVQTKALTLIHEKQITHYKALKSAILAQELESEAA